MKKEADEKGRRNRAAAGPVIHIPWRDMAAAAGTFIHIL
jgi:hypothetical protein